jgi:hypothetical protein
VPGEARRRHLAALLGAILVAPLAWLLLAAGQDRPDRMDAGVTGLQRTLACLLAGGLLVSLVATVRRSPLGAALTGGGYAALHVAALVFPAATMHLFPHSVVVAGRSVDPTAPLRTGTVLLIGVALLAAAFGLGRRRTPGKRTRQPPPETRPATPGVAGRRPKGSPPRPDNRRSSSFGPPGNAGRDHRPRNRQVGWPSQ